jgi:hypothetical protein
MAQVSIPGRFNRLFQKLLSTKGGAIVTDIGGELIPVLPLFWGVENRYLEGWDRFGLAFAVAAGGAGNNSLVRLRNSLTSGVVAVIEKVFLWNPLTTQYRLFVGGPTPNDLATAVTGLNSRWDARGRPTSSLSLSQQNNAALVLGSFQFAYNAAVNDRYDVIVDDDQEFPILPGDALTIGENIVNQALNAIVWWRERALEDSELK